MSIDTETATANWRKSCPLMPGMNATGTNTESKTKVIARIGPVISVMAFLHASAIVSSGSSSITRSMFSTTTMASSTTIPMASTSASKETVLAEYPMRSNTANVPTMDTGTATRGMSVVRNLPRNRNTTIATKTMAITIVQTTSSIVAVTKTVASKNTLCARSLGNRADSVFMVSRTCFATSTALDPGS